MCTLAVDYALFPPLNPYGSIDFLETKTYSHYYQDFILYTFQDLEITDLRQLMHTSAAEADMPCRATVYYIAFTKDKTACCPSSSYQLLNAYWGSKLAYDQIRPLGISLCFFIIGLN